MHDSMRAAPDLEAFVREPGPHPGRVSSLATALIGSEILKIAGDIRALVASGRAVTDFTVGDFAPRYFPVPERFAEALMAALARGETNYPPSNGLPELRRAVRDAYARDLGLEYPVESVVIASGARPAIYTTFLALVDPGDRVVYPVPSWNNNHYVHLVGATGVPVACGPEERFLPTREVLLPFLADARLLCLNSPLNPAGTVLTRQALAGICEAVLDENRARATAGARPLYVMYDQVYWMLSFGDAEHVTPPDLFPEMARYTVLVDGISKSFAATGLRVGWAVGPVDVIARMSLLLGHVGAWAPRAEQAATAVLLDDVAAVRDFQRVYRRKVEARLDRLHAGLRGLAAEGLDVTSIPPMGAIYLTVQFPVFGRRTPDGATLRTNEDIRRYLLDRAGVAVIPFQAFGSTADDGWFRFSIGAVSEDDIDSALGRLGSALRGLA